MMSKEAMERNLRGSAKRYRVKDVEGYVRGALTNMGYYKTNRIRITKGNA